MSVQINYGPYTAEVDDYGYLVGITNAHHKVHEGELFILSDVQTIAASGAYLIKTPSSSVAASATCHLFINISSSKALRIDVYEGCTHSASGTALTPINTNRYLASSVPGASTKFYRGPTYTVVTTLLYTEHFAGTDSNPRTSIPGVGRKNAELVLAQDTYYLVKLVSDAADTKYSIEFEFYEDNPHPNS